MRVFWIIAALLLQFPIGMHYFRAHSGPKLMPQDYFDQDIQPAAHETHKYLHFLKGKRIGLVVNHTSVIHQTHLVDSLVSLGMKVQKIFAPEHGFRGKADHGEHVKDEVDPSTKVPIISLYGKNLKPSPALLADLDIIVFDIQDVGVRFYTYTSTMTYMMEACAAAKIPMLVLDRPNPLGHYVDGPILKAEQRSFVGLNPVPIVHGLTTAEYARMINGEGWLRDSLKCELYHVECLNYNHRKFYQLPVKPSPNLPNMHSIYLYPSLCLFEGTPVSVGRGTNQQFQIYGHPDFKGGNYSFTPKPGEGSKTPVLNGQLCQGFDLSKMPIQELQAKRQLQLELFIEFFQKSPATLQASFFNRDNFFNLLAGNTELMQAIKAGKSAKEIRLSWEPELEAYRKLRKKYLLYLE